MTDQERLDWLEADSDRLEDVRGRVNNEGVSVRAAIDWFADYNRIRAATSLPPGTYTFTGPLK